ncbi:glycosyltransferase [Alteromonas sp. C1M14]|nr:glycosyltransferase [Alteromonas sp. C1M14]MBU2977833.1 glycosyltransferase [Alteromonas sp. C1M14]
MAVYHKDNVRWIRQAITSIISQTYTSFTFLIIIDGDVAEEIRECLFAEAQQDDRIFIAQNSKNVGLAASMNYAIEWGLAQPYDFFFRMDADDISMPERMARQVSYLQHHKQVGVLGTALTEINENGDKVGARTMPVSHQQIVNVLPRRCAMNHPTVAFRYDIFHKGFRYNSELMNTQDYFFWIRLAKEGVIFRNLKDRLLAFRRVNDFYKRRGFSKSINEFRARIAAMRTLNKLSLWNLFYALSVLAIRMLPPKLVKLAYKLDRVLLEKSNKS